MSILKDLPSPIFNNVENECHHLKGGRLVFLSPSPAVCVPVTAVTEDGNIHVLISRRGSGTPNYKHSYNLVCGYLDHKEEVQEAAKRELWEEVGLHVDAIKEENIIYSIDQLPWAINSAKDTSNLSLRFGLHFSCKDKTELPELTNVNSEPNEAYDTGQTSTLFDAKLNQK